MAELNWTDAQWQKVNDAVTEAFGKASVASAFLPCYGPLAGSAEIVRNERLLEDEANRTIRLDADHSAVNLKLVNLTVKVELSSEQIAEESLSNALLAFRRAANILAQEEDLVVFAGYDREPAENSKYVLNKIAPQKGLADVFARRTFKNLDDILKSRKLAALTAGRPTSLGQAIVSAVVDSVGVLEKELHPGPFACILGDEFFNAVHDPSNSMVLPADRIGPQLKGGPLLRSSKVDPKTGIIVSLAASAVDIVVGTPPTVQFLQRTASAKYLFRVYERFALRLRDKQRLPVAGFTIRTPDSLAKDTSAIADSLAKGTRIPTLRLEKARLDRILARFAKDNSSIPPLARFETRLQNVSERLGKIADDEKAPDSVLDDLIDAVAYLLGDLKELNSNPNAPVILAPKLLTVEAQLLKIP